MVVDYMGEVSHVDLKREHFIMSYSSDPILMLGATKVWHYTKEGLSKYSLPQLTLFFGETC